MNIYLNNVQTMLQRCFYLSSSPLLLPSSLPFVLPFSTHIFLMILLLFSLAAQLSFSIIRMFLHSISDLTLITSDLVGNFSAASDAVFAMAAVVHSLL
jgi:hypothetical protein